MDAEFEAYQEKFELEKKVQTLNEKLQEATTRNTKLERLQVQQGEKLQELDNYKELAEEGASAKAKMERMADKLQVIGRFEFCP